MTKALFIALIAIPIIALAQDPGLPDSLIIGNLDRTPIIAELGERISVPVWLLSDDSVNFMHIPVATDNDYVVSRDDGQFFMLRCVDDASFGRPDTGSPYPGWTSQSILCYGYMDFIRWDRCFGDIPPDPPDPNHVWWQMAAFTMTVTGDSSALGDTTHLMEGHGPANEGLLFGLVGGERSFVPQAVWGSICVRPLLSGDANGSGTVNGIDVIYLVNYLRGIGPAPMPLRSGDANGDCEINGLDIVYLVSYLKGFGPAPVMGDCP